MIECPIILFSSYICLAKIWLCARLSTLVIFYFMCGPKVVSNFMNGQCVCEWFLYHFFWHLLILDRRPFSSRGHFESSFLPPWVYFSSVFFSHLSSRQKLLTGRSEVKFCWYRRHYIPRIFSIYVLWKRAINPCEALQEDSSS